MSLIPGNSGDKTVLKDGAMVDHLSENTVGHGVRVKGISDPTAYPVIAGDVGQTIVTTFGPTPAVTTNIPFSIGSVVLAAGTWLVFVNGSIYSTTGTGHNYYFLDVNTSLAARASTEYVSRAAFAGNTTHSMGNSAPLVVNTTGGTTVYAIGQYAFTGLGDSVMRAVITAVRIA